MSDPLHGPTDTPGDHDPRQNRPADEESLREDWKHFHEEVGDRALDREAERELERLEEELAALEAAAARDAEEPDAADDDEDDEFLDDATIERMVVPEEALSSLEPIPEVLHSAYCDGPFTQCHVCESTLRDHSQIYHLEKVMRQDECVFEMALCIRCAGNLHKQFSRESKRALRQFFSRGYEPSSDPDSCHLCHEESAHGTDRILTAACAKDRLVMPMVVVCSSCVERSQDLLSQETKDTYSDFIETHFPGVPAEWEPAPTAAF